MSFTCKECGATSDAVEMAGIVIGQVSREMLAQKGLIQGTKALTGQEVARKLSGGFLNGFGIKCPKCNAIGCW